jgi:hypothetical protein
MPTFKFDRYVDGKKMAEGVNAGEHTDLASATKAAARLASPGPKGQVPVLVLRNVTGQSVGNAII